MPAATAVLPRRRWLRIRVGHCGRPARGLGTAGVPHEGRLLHASPTRVCYLWVTHGGRCSSWLRRRSCAPDGACDSLAAEPYVEPMTSIPQELRLLIDQRYGVSGEATRVAAGISGSVLWKVSSPQPMLVRVSGHFDLQHMAHVCDGVRRIAPAMEEVVAPLVAGDGEMAFLWDNRPVTVWPFIPGVVLDRSDPEQVRQAARLLAELHQLRPGLEAADEDAIPGADNAVSAAELFPDHELDEWLSRWHGRVASADRLGWRHGDFFERNIMCRDGAVVGLVDWDDISFGPTDVELAWATWEFGKSARGDRLVPQSAALFLDEYRQAGGPMTPLGDLIPLIRERLRRDIAFFRGIAASHGFAIDVGDEDSKIQAFRSLTESHSCRGIDRTGVG